MTYLQYSGNKYHAKKSEYNGYIYDSKMEAAFAHELDLRQKAGEIESWERQIKLELRINGYHICDYKIDFIIHYPDGSREFCEVKGLELPLWRLKWKILEAMFENFRKHPDDRLLVVKQNSIRMR